MTILQIVSDSLQAKINVFQKQGIRKSGHPADNRRFS